MASVRAIMKLICYPNTVDSLKNIVRYTKYSNYKRKTVYSDVM